MTLVDLVSLIPLLVAAYGVVLGGVALSLGWQLLSDRVPGRFRRGARVPREGGIGPNPEVIR